jgi:cyclopropane fatty-acyl-phospholipid synthase-like methyltransferase
LELRRNTEQGLIADPSNARMVEAWDGNEGAFWVAQTRRLDETLANCHGPFLTAAAVREDDPVLDVGCGNGNATATWRGSR